MVIWNGQVSLDDSDIYGIILMFIQKWFTGQKVYLLK